MLNTFFWLSKSDYTFNLSIGAAWSSGVRGMINRYIYTRIYSPWWQAFNNRGWFIDKVIITIQKCQEGTKEGKRQKGGHWPAGSVRLFLNSSASRPAAHPLSLSLFLSLSLSPFPLLSPSLSVLIKPKDDLIAKNVNNNIKNTTEAAARRRQNNLRPNRTRNNLLFFPFF